ncbi:hypothetical protein J3L16_08680 [Alteromonas sp. 5E99-2]|uniref:hypothetical protein n=1 Tax=Alteromonas sp. 5E99-2 TaxID=2817683 RepID=UPI001A986840|nr:hypothetical protein [Alteromonas sp. 5E99-2]MBO1255756.1 hypothetical protein [Alteromonas sp. 5E99-2]
MSDILRKVKFVSVALSMCATLGQSAFANEKILGIGQMVEKKKVSAVNNSSDLFAKMALHTSKKQRPQNKQYLLNENMPYSNNKAE